MKTLPSSRLATVRAWGNGHGVLLPKSVIDGLNLVDTRVSVSVRGTSMIVLTKAPPASRKLTLSDMVRGVSRRDKHDVVDFGVPIGREIW